MLEDTAAEKLFFYVEAIARRFFDQRQTNPLLSLENLLGFTMKKNLLKLINTPLEFPSAFINQYKRHDVFRCSHDAHHHFNNTVSVYHVLKAKKCYPQGCIYFRWRCKKINTGQQCIRIRKYKHVGRACFGCRYFFDIKEINRPEPILTQEAFNEFQQELKRFENWLFGLQGRQVDFSGRINSIKPHYRVKMVRKRPRIFFEGFLMNFSEAFINTTLFNDFIYASFSSRLQGKFGFAKDDSVCFQGYLSEQNGMIMIKKIRGVEVQEKSEKTFWTESRARVAQRTGTILPYQSEKCHACDKGTLIDIIPDDVQGSKLPRTLFCLEGITDPEECCYSLKKNLRLHDCSHDQKAHIL